jgi:TetR/AcrR family transcriptional repressor of bet genes
MRHVMTIYGAEVRGALCVAQSPTERLEAILRASFGPANFRREAVGAWLNFWVLAQTVPEARRLLAVYQRRLRSNLLVGLRPLAGARAEAIADGIGALIDGLYLREVLKSGPPDGAAAVAMGLEYLRAQLANLK